MKRIILALAIVLSLTIAAPAGATIYPATPTLAGTNIPWTVATPDGSTFYLQADQPSHFGLHGWAENLYPYNGDPGYLSWTQQQQLGWFNDDLWREDLYVGPVGGTLTLVPQQKLYQFDTDPAGIGTLYKRWYVNFPAGTFAPGSYTFEVVFFADPTVPLASSSQPQLVKTFTVAFT